MDVNKVNKAKNLTVASPANVLTFYKINLIIIIIHFLYSATSK